MLDSKGGGSRHLTGRPGWASPTRSVGGSCGTRARTKGWSQAASNAGRIVGERELTMMRWGMPGPEQYGGHPVTNIRNTRSPHWRRWLGPAHRCLVPVTSFSEWEDTKPKKTAVWFALSEERPPFAFAGIWTNWTGTRGPKSNPVEGEHELYGFLTCGPNETVGAIHPKAMPVLLSTPDEMDT
ncbi:SOS response-associated peptidase family protein [Teichococcus rhizosphaerae]|uniref:SOS response-associated peptidase family protein n=1 Tax=Teichococcus rhizosphaerae TaxID=1335062 RepID=UPI002481D8FF|nr:SOS response-associated peptidase family protein [Pseudoroseomonas rhizosphaerae]